MGEQQPCLVEDSGNKYQVLYIARGYLAMILFQTAWKRIWVGYDPTQSKMAVDRSVATTGMVLWAQILIAKTTGWIIQVVI